MNSRSMAAAGLLGAIALTAGACTAGSADETDGRIPVVASTNVWGSVVSAVGGDAVSVKSLIDSPLADPHSYESTAEDGLEFSESKLAVVNGGGYDEFALKLAAQAPDVPVINAVELAGTESSTHGQEDVEMPEGEHSDEHGHEAGGANEHVWYDPHTVEKVAEEVAERLGKIDPENAETFSANAEKFAEGVEALEKELEGLPEGKVLATEPVAHYLIEAAGLTDATPEDFSEAVEGETDVPVAAQAEVTELVERKQVAVVINNPQTETDVTTQLVATAEKSGVPVVEMTETLPEGQSDYLAWLSDEVAALKAALAK